MLVLGYSSIPKTIVACEHRKSCPKIDIVKQCELLKFLSLHWPCLLQQLPNLSSDNNPSRIFFPRIGVLTDVIFRLLNPGYS